MEGGLFSFFYDSESCGVAKREFGRWLWTPFVYHAQGAVSTFFSAVFFFFFCSALPVPLLPHCWDNMDGAREKSRPAVSIEEKQQREGKAWHCCFVCDGKETGKQKNIINHHKYLLSCVGSKKERNLHYIVCTLFTCTRAAPSGLMTDPPPV